MMKRILLVLTLLTSCLAFSFGQSAADSITMKQQFGGYQFYQDGYTLNMSQLGRELMLNEQAHKEFKGAQVNYVISSIIGGAGGFMVGWTLGTAIAGGEPNWALAGIGAGLIVVSIPISQKVNKQVVKAVNIYNGGLDTSSRWENTELRLAMTGNGFGLTLRF